MIVHTRSANNKFAVIMICLLPFFNLYSCASSRILTLRQNPGCRTSVEGFYRCFEPWDKAKPAVIIRQGRDLKIISGEIVARDDEGVTLDPSGEGYIGDPEPEYFKFDKIEALIDGNGDVEYGKIPEMYSGAYALELHLQLQDDPESEPVVVLLKPNERFGLCTPPGDYIVSTMRFKNDYRSVTDEGVDVPKLRISVMENRSNYIGDIYMDCGDEKMHEPFVIQYKVGDGRSYIPRTSDGNTELIGLLAGGIAAGIYEASQDRKRVVHDPDRIIGEHRLFIEKNDDFMIEGKSPKHVSIIEHAGG